MNDVILRQKLEVLSFEVHKVSRSHEAEAVERQIFLLELQRYATQMQKGVNSLLQVAQEANVLSDLRLGNIAHSMTPDMQIPVETDPTPTYEAAKDHDHLSQDHAGLYTYGDQPDLDERPQAWQDGPDSR